MISCAQPGSYMIRQETSNILTTSQFDVSMSSLKDLPNEVLQRIESEIRGLLALVRVNHHFYSLFSSALYATFGRGPLLPVTNWENRESRYGKRLIGFLSMIDGSTLLASHVKHLQLVGDWKAHVREFARDTKHQQTSVSLLKAAFYAANTGLFADLILARLPRLEKVSLVLMDQNDYLNWVITYSNLREFSIGGYGEC
jgi:hypothetical protein